MDTRTGDIYEQDALDRLDRKTRDRCIEMKQPPTPKQAKDRKVGRNEPCPCGSGKKFKRCHYTGGGYLSRKINRLVNANSL